MIFSLKHIFYPLILVTVIFSPPFEGYSTPPETIPPHQQAIQNKGSTQDLFIAIKKKDINEIKNLMNRGLNVNEVNGEGRTPLMAIIDTLDVTLLDNFLKEYGTKVDFNVRNKQNRNTSALDEAAYKHNLDMVKILFKYGKAQMSQVKDWASTPLIYAVEAGDESLVNFFLQEGIDPKTVKTEPPLLSHMFLMGGTPNLKVMEALLKVKMDPNSPDKEGKTPLHRAVETNNIELVKALLNGKANPDQPDQAHLSPRELALQQGTRDLIKLFKPLQSVDVNKQFRYAASVGSVSKITAAFNEAKKPEILNLKDMVGNTMLSQVVSSGKPDAVQTFLDLAKTNKVTLEINAKNSSFGSTALHAAVSTGNPAIVKLLLAYKADVNIVDNRKQTPLFWALFSLTPGSLNLTIIHLLLEAGARTKITDVEGNTPLKMAEEYKQVNPGADVLINLLKNQTQ